jgi:hypothetical protein
MAARIDLEAAIIENLQPFLLELGKGFAFVSRQYRIATESQHFFIDLVFYNFLLKCFVLIDLKIGRLEHQDVGQMDMYLRMFDEFKRGVGDLHVSRSQEKSTRFLRRACESALLV